MKVKILDVNKLYTKSLLRRYKVKISLKNWKNEYRVIEIGQIAYRTLNLDKNKEIIVYKDKRNNIKIDYKATFKLYDKEYKQYINN